MRALCTVEGCDQVVSGHGFCNKHYLRWKKHGDALGGSRNHARPDERFWRRVAKSDGCWLWTGARAPNGYGRFQIGGKGGPYLGAHRFSYELAHGPIPKGMVVMHSCDTPSCVNPAHLSARTPKDNSRDMISKGRKRTVVPIGVENGMAVLNPEMVREIRANSEESHAALARRLGVSPSTVRGVRSGRTWSHIN